MSPLARVRPARLLVLALAAGLVPAAAGCAGESGPSAASAGEAAMPASSPSPAAALLAPGTLGGPTRGPLGRYLAEPARAARALPDVEVEQGAATLRLRLPADVLFEPGSATLRPASRARLRALASLLDAYPRTHVLVVAHGAAEGAGGAKSPENAEARSLRISAARARAVRAALVAKGVAPERLTAIGLGEAFPLASPDAPLARQRSRRVELELRPDARLRAEARASGTQGEPAP